MAADDTMARIRTFVSRFMRGHPLTDDDDIFATGFVNSMFAMQLVQFLESEFGIMIESEDLELDNFRSIRAMSELVARKLPAATA